MQWKILQAGTLTDSTCKKNGKIVCQQLQITHSSTHTHKNDTIFYRPKSECGQRDNRSRKYYVKIASKLYIINTRI